MRRSLALSLVVLSFVSAGCANAEDPTVPVEEVEDTDVVADSVAADTTVPADTGEDDTAVDDTGTADTRVTDTGRADTRDAGSDARDASVTDSARTDSARTDMGSDDTGSDASDDASSDAATDGSSDAATDDSADAGVVCGVVVNELQTGDSSNGREWVELYNPCPTTIAVGNFSVVYRGNAGTTDVLLHKFAAAATLTAGQYFVIANSKFAGAKDVTFVNPNQLAETGGALAIRNATGGRVDSVGWGNASTVTTFVEGMVAPAPTDVFPAKSLARKVDGIDTNHNANDFAVTATPTPKAANVITP